MAEEESENEGKLNYYINFPSPVTSQRQFNDADPIVILFGWAGCQDKYLIKYSDVWLKQGCITLRYICPSETLFWHSENIPTLTDQLVDEILDKDGLDLAQNPVIFHIFSGAGCILLLSMFESLRNKKLQLAIKGIVFDSAPGESSYWSKALAYNEATASDQITGAQKYFWSYMYYWYFWFCDYYKYYRDWMTGKQEPYETYFQRLQKETLPQLQMYLYSKSDYICRSDSIEKFMKIQQDKGVAELKAVCWSDTLHCQHLRNKRDEYLSAVNEFLDKLFTDGDDFVRVSLS